METAITALIVIGVLILSVLGLTERSMSAQATISEATRALETRIENRVRTSLTPIGASSTGGTVEVIVKNTGSTRLTDFDKWDVILDYTDGGGGFNAGWYAYSTKWSKQIYQVAKTTLEVFDPGILNPGEEVVIQINVLPWVGTGTTNRATITAPNGIGATTVFTR